jgi:hypothetical protein
VGRVVDVVVDRVVDVVADVAADGAWAALAQLANVARIGVAPAP